MIDLHSHTQHSDGSSTVRELLEEAEKCALSLLSITDHNSVGAYTELDYPNIRRIFNGNIINGVEITTHYMGEIIEVLGYGFDLETMREYLKKYTLEFRDKQLKEFELIKARYREIGVKFDEANIKFDPDHESCRGSFREEIVRHRENDKFFLHQESMETNRKFSREEVYNPESPLHVDELSLYPDLQTTIGMIHNSGGLAFLAHTFEYSKSIPEALDNIIEFGLDGIECYYSTFTEEQTETLVNLCKQRELLMSGGSDFHGTVKKKINIGVGEGNLHIPGAVVSNWIEQDRIKG